MSNRPTYTRERPTAGSSVARSTHVTLAVVPLPSKAGITAGRFAAAAGHRTKTTIAETPAAASPRTPALRATRPHRSPSRRSHVQPGYVLPSQAVAGQALRIVRGAVSCAIGAMRARSPDRQQAALVVFDGGERSRRKPRSTDLRASMRRLSAVRSFPGSRPARVGYTLQVAERGPRAEAPPYIGAAGPCSPQGHRPGRAPRCHQDRRDVLTSCAGSVRIRGPEAAGMPAGGKAQATARGVTHGADASDVEAAEVHTRLCRGDAVQT
jgi:hypothetical protein